MAFRAIDLAQGPQLPLPEHEYRNRAAFEHVFGDTPQDKFPDAAVTIGAHHK